MTNIARLQYSKYMLGNNDRLKAAGISVDEHKRRVLQELRDAGASGYGLMHMESHYLPQIIHPNEHIGGVIYGHFEEGFAMLVATDLRVIFLDRKPFFTNQEEITYDVVSGINFGHAGFSSSVTLHTRIKDYHIRTLNLRCADQFVEYIEYRCLEHGAQERPNVLPLT